VHARNGQFDGVVAMIHDHGHIALKLMAGLFAVNVTLGLPIVRQIVELHGGRVWCESEEGHGTVFRLLFPVVIS